MKLYCASCGKQLFLIRKAMPKFGIIIDIVAYHECAEEPIPFDLNSTTKYVPVEEKDKWVQSLNALEPSRNQAFKAPQKEEQVGERKGFGSVGTDDLRDRRFDTTKPLQSTAPQTIAEQIRLMSNSIPANEVKDIEQGTEEKSESSEMGN
jgi:hypothetical protein